MGHYVKTFTYNEEKATRWRIRGPFGESLCPVQAIPLITIVGPVLTVKTDLDPSQAGLVN